MTERPDEREPPAAMEPSTPEEPQSSVHFQPVGPQVVKSDAASEAVERTLEEESLRRRASEEEGGATESRRDEPR